ncbi:MAG: long-chain fatty acid--CoA ligase [Planctomycetaceae bacterium]|jgi:long-chain acyl-CoA synthetase|nr:long-chain fatty acid--CoA ligase [Planctomycetaceae bacterium]
MGLNLAFGLIDSAIRFPNHPAIICNNRSYSYAELNFWSAQIANVLRSQGMRYGDHVMLLAPNVPEFTAVYYAVLRAGGVVVPINTLLLANEIAELLEHSDSRFFFAWHTFAEKSLLAFEQIDSCQSLFFIGAKRQELSESILAHYSAAPLHQPNKFVLDELLPDISATSDDENDKDNDYPHKNDFEQTSSNETAIILYTSGTTGRSKGVELSHFNIFSNALYAKEKALFIDHNSTAIAVLPLFHTFGQTAIQNASILAGSTMVMVPQFEPKRTLREIEKHRVSYIAAVPTMYNLMLQTLRRRSFDVSSLKVAVSGGAPLPLSIYNEFEQLFGFKIIEGYGLSETSPISCITPVNAQVNKAGSIGLEFYGTQAKIIRLDGSTADIDEIGELMIRGHNVMKGYYKDPSATESVFIDGWFRTGDMATMDADRYFYIVDRLKDVIIRAGMNIYPREIEEVLHHHPAVREVAVIGIPDDALSENVTACVVLIEDAEVTAMELQKYCREHLAVYKCPKVILFMESLPKNSTGKIMKRTLREMQTEK